MKLILCILIFSLVSCSQAPSREPANDAIWSTVNALTDKQEEEPQRYCRGNPPGQDDAWCSWVCLNGKWSKVCR